MKINDIEFIKYITQNFWFGVGYNNIDFGKSEIDEVRLISGYTTNSHFAVKRNDPLNFRVEVIHNKETGNKIYAVKFFKKF